MGRPCFPGANDDAGVPQTIVASPALECQSRTCLHLADRGQDLCTGECTVDADCEASPETPCKGGFVCMIPVTAGAFCCKRMCVCRDYVVIPDAGVTDPAGCVASNPVNECCNLVGRREDPTRYPVCQR